MAALRYRLSDLPMKLKAVVEFFLFPFALFFLSCPVRGRLVCLSHALRGDTFMSVTNTGVYRFFFSLSKPIPYISEYKKKTMNAVALLCIFPNVRFLSTERECSFLRHCAPQTVFTRAQNMLSCHV